MVWTGRALVPDPPDYPVFNVGDGILHGAAFTYLSFALVLLSSQWSAQTLRTYVRVFVVMLMYGALIELLQGFIPERSAEYKDLLVDSLGIGLGLGVAAVAVTPLKRVLT